MAVSFFTRFLDLLAPPRPSERIVRELTLDELYDLRGSDDGSLPYHNPSVRALVWEIKYYANQRALELAGALMRERLLEAGDEALGVPLIIPVPMHKERKRERGHNQTELLCKATLKESSIAVQFEYAPNLLERTIATAPQQGLPESKRRHNVEHSMEVVHPERIKGRACIIVDDVSTTGATMDEARRALRRAGARTIIQIALAQS